MFNTPNIKKMSETQFNTNKLCLFVKQQFHLYKPSNFIFSLIKVLLVCYSSLIFIKPDSHFLGSCVTVCYMAYFLSVTAECPVSTQGASGPDSSQDPGFPRSSFHCRLQSNNSESCKCLRISISQQYRQLYVNDLEGKYYSTTSLQSIYDVQRSWCNWSCIDKALCYKK